MSYLYPRHRQRKSRLLDDWQVNEIRLLNADLPDTWTTMQRVREIKRELALTAPDETVRSIIMNESFVTAQKVGS